MKQVLSIIALLLLARSASACLPPPDAAVNLTATDSESATSITISWDDVAGESGYDLLVSTSASGTFTTLTTLGANVVTYDHIISQSIRHYKVSAFSGPDYGAFSNTDQGSSRPWYHPAELVFTIGSVATGGISDLLVIDSVVLEIDEVSNNPGFDFYFIFRNVPETRQPGVDINIKMNVRYNGNPNDGVVVQIRNHVTNTWESITGAGEDIPNSGSFADFFFDVHDMATSEHFSASNELWIRVLHNSQGIPTHSIEFDYVIATPTPDPDVLCNVTVAHWEMDDDAANSTVEDSVGGFDGTFNDAGGDPNTDAHTTPGVSVLTHTALNLDSVDDYIDVTSGLGITDYPFSISGWFITSAASGGIISMNDRSDSDIYQAVTLSGANQHLVLNSRNGGGPATAESANAVNDGNWHFFAAILESATARHIYVDDEVVVTDTTSVMFSSFIDNTAIGRLRYVSSAVLFAGDIDDLRVYNVAINEDKIEALFNDGLGTEQCSAPTNPIKFVASDGDYTTGTQLDWTVGPGVGIPLFYELDYTTSTEVASYTDLDSVTSVAATQTDYQWLEDSGLKYWFRIRSWNPFGFSPGFTFDTGFANSEDNAVIDYTTRRVRSTRGTSYYTSGSKTITGLGGGPDIRFTDSVYGDSMTTGSLYLNDDDDFGWRFIRSGENLLIQKHESGVWVTKSTITP